ncbi:MAG: histidine kinase dimerization/phospho-acceptor domain-containing protein, partial [Candidatus Cloacimonadaceae bacterium]|nr:histidine kinase dimerization/phospho-acceptor domain-containing protein [Candidatus Cloacimonadaceae bacterium]
HTYTLSAHHYDDDVVSFDDFPVFSSDIHQPYLVGKNAGFSSGDSRLSLIYAYSSFSILKTEFGLIYAKERASVLSGILAVASGLTVIFALIIGITIFAFSRLIRIIRREELNMARIQKAVDNATDMILITSVDMEPLFRNQAFFSTCDPVLTKSNNPVALLISNDEKTEEIRKGLETESSWAGEVELRIRQGLTIPCLLRANVIKDAIGIQIGYLFIATDITERKRAERMKNEFISTVSHELRTPLTSIRGSLGLIKGGVSGDISPHAKKLVEIAYTNSERLIRLINDILDIEKIEAGAMEFHMQKVEILSEINRSVKLMMSYASQYNVDIKLGNSLPGVE